MADQRAIVNASPLIFLASSGYIEFLQLLHRQVSVPEAVAAEIQHYGADDPTARVVQSTPWLQVEPLEAIPADARPVIEQLRGAGMFLSDTVVNSALALVGE